MSYKVYWNNICLISNLEEKYISKLCAEKKLPLNIEYYGLGREYSLFDKVSQDIDKGSIEADIIVSTDLDVFQDSTLLKSRISEFSSVTLFPTLNSIVHNSNIIDKTGYFTPFITIPLVLVYNKQLVPSNKIPKSFKDLLQPYYYKKVAFGGAHNSAGRSLFKSLFYLYGESKTKQFIESCHKGSMPAAAFQMVASGQVPIAIVPTIFAIRRGINNIDFVWPKEGAVAIPSYVAFKNTVADKDKQLIINTLLGKDFQQLLNKSADIIPSHIDTNSSVLITNEDQKLLYPSWQFTNNLNHSEFYQWCNSL